MINLESLFNTLFIVYPTLKDFHILKDHNYVFERVPYRVYGGQFTIAPKCIAWWEDE
jgi:hypothetical protein